MRRRGRRRRRYIKLKDPEIYLLHHLREVCGFPSDRAAAEWTARVNIPRILVAGRIVVLRSTLLEWLKEHETTHEDTNDAAAKISDDLRIRRRLP